LTLIANSEQFGMTALVELSTTAARPVIAPIAALALLLPLPVRCGACCSEENPPAKAVCCQSRPNDTPTSDLACFVKHDSRCTCCIQPTNRSTSPSDRTASPIDLSSALPALTFAACFVDTSNLSELFRFGIAAPRIPHRILHCSWQI
jgi:hypothetical protein